MGRLKSVEHKESKEQRPWRTAVAAILALGLGVTLCGRACQRDTGMSSSRALATTRPQESRLRVTQFPQPNYFPHSRAEADIPTSIPGIFAPSIDNSATSTAVPLFPSDAVTSIEQRLIRGRELCHIGDMVATDVQAQLAQSGRGYSFGIVHMLTRNILDADYRVPGVPASDDPARSATVVTCIEDEIDELAIRELRVGSRAQGRRILAAGGSIPAIFGVCDQSPLREDGIPNEEFISCLHEMLDDRVATLSGAELQRLFERVLEQNPYLAFTFFPGARIEVQTAIRGALNAIIADQSERIANLLRAQSQVQIERPTMARYFAMQIAIMRPLSDYQSVLEELSPNE